MPCTGTCANAFLPLLTYLAFITPRRLRLATELAFILNSLSHTHTHGDGGAALRLEKQISQAKKITCATEPPLFLGLGTDLTATAIATLHSVVLKHPGWMSTI